MVLLAFAPAWADFYHPSDVAAASVAFQAASERSASSATDAQRSTRSAASALAAYDEALDLLGPDAPLEQRTRAEALESKYNRDFAVLQAFADQSVAEFDTAFVGALERALSTHPGAVRCERELAVGRPLPGMASRTEKNPDCVGTDLNASLASAMDADPQLKAELDALLARPWPELSIDPAPVAAIGPGSKTVQVADFFREAMPDALRDIRRADEDAREKFAVAIEAGVPKEQLAAMVNDAKAVDAKTGARRYATAEPVLLRVAKRWEKAGEFAWCAQPVALGGCEGTDASRDEIPGLLADKKVAKALP